MFSWADERICSGLKTEFELAMVNESLVFESLKFYCTPQYFNRWPFVGGNSVADNFVLFLLLSLEYCIIPFNLYHILGLLCSFQGFPDINLCYNVQQIFILEYKAYSTRKDIFQRIHDVYTKSRKLRCNATWRLYNVALTSMQRYDVASTLMRPCINVIFPLKLEACSLKIDSKPPSTLPWGQWEAYWVPNQKAESLLLAAFISLRHCWRLETLLGKEQLVASA